MKQVPVIGIVGGVGAGKSAVANYVVEHANVVIVDGDQVGHEGLKNPEIKAQIKAVFGDDVLDEHGEIIRGKLGKMVFGTSALPQKNLQKLNAIMHPWMEKRFQELIEKYRSERKHEAILFDAAILLDAGWDRFCDRIVYVDVSQSVREKRVREQRAWSKEMHQQREASQLKLEQKRSRADKLILNDGRLEEAGQELLSYLHSQY